MLRVQDILIQADTGKMPGHDRLINLGEVLYIVERERGLSSAQSVLALVESLRSNYLKPVASWFYAAHVKANYSMSYADAFAVAAAIQEQAIIITGDS